jgi:hypothetical protein
MKYLVICFVLMMTISTEVLSQAKMRKLSSSINHPSINLYAPYISADGNAMLFVSDNAEDQILTPFYTFRDATDWKAPQVFPKNIYTRIAFLTGFALSGDGKRIYVTTQKGPGVGGFDIWYADWKGSSWGDPVNFGAPLNSKGHDASPSITPDGNTMYFMRCDKMDFTKASGCKIFSISKKSNGQWAEPVELPAHINTGNSQVPRIMADGQTLYFSSDKLQPNKGGMDLYVTRLINGSWTTPEPLDFVNTEKDDQYVTAGGLGRYLMKDAFGGRKNEIVEYLIPENLRPKGMMKVEGKVTDNTGAPAMAYVAAYDLTNKKLIYNGKPAADGSFIVYLKEGSRYDLSVEPEHNNFTYFSRVFDLTSDKIPQWERVTAVVKPLAPGDELNLNDLKFKIPTGELDASSAQNELKRIARVLNGNPTIKAELQVMLTGYEEDTTQSSNDLTEVLYDSISSQYEVADTTGAVVMRDTVIVKSLYHNDRTAKQAQALIDYFSAQGIPSARFSVMTNAIPALKPEDKKLTIKIVAR